MVLLTYYSENYFLVKAASQKYSRLIEICALECSLLRQYENTLPPVTSATDI